MKKRLRFLFAVSVFCVMLGTIMTVVGLIFGGAGELSKEVKELVHVARTGISETVQRIPMLESITNINGFTLVVDIDENNFSLDMNEEYETISGNYTNYELADVTAVKNLDISFFDSTIRILPSDNGKYGVESANAGEYQCYAENDTLYLSVFPGKIGENKTDDVITLYIPEEAELQQVLLFCSGSALEADIPLRGEELQVSSVCGNNFFEQPVTFETVVATVGVGELSFHEVNSTEFRSEISTGVARAEHIQTENAEVSVGLGTFQASGTINGDMLLNCGMGSMELVLAANQDDYNYDISGSAESVQIGTDTLAGMVMERWIDNGSENNITLSCSMGSVKIIFSQP